MNFVRRYRRSIQLILMLATLFAMSYGFLRRVGIDPLAPDTHTAPAQ